MNLLPAWLRRKANAPPEPAAAASVASAAAPPRSRRPRTINSPTIRNGRGYGMLPNHALALASYRSRAHVAIADLRSLLKQG